MPKRPPDVLSVPGRPVALPGALGDLARALGGTSALAERIGVTGRSLQKWATRPPPKPIRLLLALIAREEGLSAAQQAELEQLNVKQAARKARPSNK